MCEALEENFREFSDEFHVIIHCWLISSRADYCLQNWNDCDCCWFANSVQIWQDHKHAIMILLWEFVVSNPFVRPSNRARIKLNRWIKSGSFWLERATGPLKEDEVKLAAATRGNVDLELGVVPSSHYCYSSSQIFRYKNKIESNMGIKLLSLQTCNEVLKKSIGKV